MGNLGGSGEKVDADTRISKFLKYDLRKFSTDLLLCSATSIRNGSRIPLLFLMFDKTPHYQSTNNPQLSAIISIQKLEEQDTIRVFSADFTVLHSHSFENSTAMRTSKQLQKHYMILITPGNLCVKTN